MDKGVWRATVHGIARIWTQLSNTHTHTHTHGDEICFWCGQRQTHFQDNLMFYKTFKINDCVSLTTLILFDRRLHRPTLHLVLRQQTENQ